MVQNTLIKNVSRTYIRYNELLKIVDFDPAFIRHFLFPTYKNLTAP